MREHFDMAAETVVDKATNVIRQLLGESQILYLPTYRRIEKDLKTLMPDRDESRRYRLETDGLRRLGLYTDAYAEIVEFGMEDVQGRFAEILSELSDNNRKEFSALAGSYLRDVIRGEGESYSREEIAALTTDDITSILRRVDETTLDLKEKRRLAETTIRLRKGEPTGPDAYVAHFLSKLVQSSKRLTEREQPVTAFIRVCNGYLQGKKLVYDELMYRIFVEDVPRRDREIELKYLSSGEKQVISLFAQIYLSKAKRFFVIIDEPELSLSVPWQRKLLPDLWSSGNCEFLAAVTHSPFIFDNELEGYTHDLSDGVRIDG
jgi:hypothetical protein